MNILGIDIGGTKCAVVWGNENGEIIKKEKFATTDCNSTIAKLLEIAKTDLNFEAIGISCGGPLDSEKGIIKSPPNLPGWDNIEIVNILKTEFGVPVFLKNDADACALAEWKYGAGKGTQHMLFLTFGTGLGAGLILGGRLYSGACDMAGEVGHIRLSDFGPVGYGKAGSFEGFCSGGGIAQLAKSYVMEEIQMGKAPSICPTMEELNTLTAEKVCVAAREGDVLAKKIISKCGQMLGVGLSIVMDILNPEKIVIGSVFTRARDLLWPEAEKVILEETLEYTRGVCEVVPCGLTESVGDIAALTVADYYFTRTQE